MAIIHPYSDSTKYATGGIWEPTAANFPGVPHFFKCDEAATTLTVSDSIGNVVLSGPTAFAKTDNYSIKITTGADRASAGTWTTFPTAGFGLFMVGKLGTGNVSIGGATNSDYITLTGSASNAVMVNTVNTGIYTGTNFTLTTAGTIYGRANVVSAFNTTSGQTTYEFTTTTTASALANTSTSATSSGGTAMTAGPAFGTGATTWNLAANIDVYGILIFKFAAIPSDLKAALAWMTYQWSIGNKWIYPGWKGKT